MQFEIRFWNFDKAYALDDCWILHNDIARDSMHLTTVLMGKGVLLSIANENVYQFFYNLQN